MRDASSSPALFSLWLGAGLFAHCLIALFAVLARWLQTRPSPPLAALRCALLINLIAYAGLLAGSGTMLGLQRLQRHWRQWRQWQNARQAEGAHPGQPKRRQLSSCAADLTAACNSTGTNAEPVLDGVAGGAAQHSQPADGAGAEAEPAAASELKAAPPATPPPARPPLTQQHTLYGRRLGAPQRQVPEVFLRRGLSGRFRTLEGSKPRLVRLGALAALSGSYAVGSSSQIVASGLVDASIVQLVMLFTVFGVAIVQTLLLRLRLPRLLLPCGALMLGGSAMVLVPTIGASGAKGGLDSSDGWLGFSLAILTMLATVVNFVCLQASRGFNFTSIFLLHCYLPLTITLLLPLSLGIDGADWSGQFSHWDAGAVVLLVCAATIVYLGGNFLLQNATWQLGAPMVSLLYGLRLVAAIVEQKVVLQATVIRSGLQVAGVVLSVAAVSAYMAAQLMQSRRRNAVAQAAQAGEPGDPP